MGGLSIINTEIRCSNCFHIYTMKISPEFPMLYILKSCKCPLVKVDSNKFLTEYKKNKKITIQCSKCNKVNAKDSLFCDDCKKIFCSNCFKTIHQTEELKIHKYISVDKYDFFCMIHQTENFCAYCKTCKLDICAKCTKENLHEKHKIIYFDKSYDEKKMKDFLKKAIKNAEAKIEYNKVICNMICKKFNKEESKNLKILHDINESDNKHILEIINIFNEMYDASKTKNNALISNLIDNLDFNFEKIKFEKSTTKDKDKEDLSNYFKTDFIIKIKQKKEEKKNKNADKQEATDVKEKDNIESNEINNAEEKKEEEKKEEEKKEEEIKDEEKKEEEKKEEIKKEEEKKEEEKKEEEKNEEEKENKGGHSKSLKEMKKFLKEKLELQGGFKQNNVSNSSMSIQRNDIINEPKGNPENVINIIQNQQINKKAKKKPRKINFDS